MIKRGRRGIPAIALLAWALLAIPATIMAHGDDDDDDDDDDDEDEAHGPHFHSVEEMGGEAERSEVPETWLTRGQITRPYLLEVQAIIVKDEQVTDDCKPSNADLRKSNWRHFVCYGSILSNTFVLTTTTCLHEVLYIRHNIQASLAVVIAPVSESIQVIKISQYIIHPKLELDPRHTQDHIKHNVAIAKLSCKISKRNFFPIELPTKPLSDICKGDQCYVTVIKRKEDHTNLIFEYVARDIEYHKMSVRQTNPGDNTKDNDNMNAATVTRLMCTKTGSAVMANKIQAGMVAMSCDVRQPETSWLYTDLYDNVDWIVSVADLEKPKEYINEKAEVPNEKPPEKCSSCVYNFYFDGKQKDMCPNKIINDLGGSLTTCQGNSADPAPKQNPSTFITAYPKDDYLRALDAMYRDQFKHNHQGVPIAPPSEDKKSINEQMIPVTNNFAFTQKNGTNSNDANKNVDASKPTENDNQPSDEKLSINDHMIPVSDNFEISKKTEADNNDGNQNTDTSKPKDNIDQKAETRKKAEVPDEYKALYEQYMQEVQLKNN